MDSNNRLHEGIRVHHTHINLERPQSLRYRTRLHQPPQETFEETRKHQYRLTKRATCSRSRKEPNRVTSLSSFPFNMVLQNSLKDDIPRWQKKKGMGIYLTDNDHGCLTNLRYADDVLLFATFKEQLQKMLCELKKSTEKVGPRIHPGKTNILSKQSSPSSDTTKEMEVEKSKY